MLNSSSHPRAVSHPLLVAPMLTATVMGRWWLANISGTHPLHWSSYRVVVRYHTNNCVTVCKLSLARYLSSPFFLLRHIHTHTHTHTLSPSQPAAQLVFITALVCCVSDILGYYSLSLPSLLPPCCSPYFVPLPGFSVFRASSLVPPLLASAAI